MTKVPDFTPEKWESWLKDKTYAEERVEHLEDELDKALDEQDRLSRAAEDLRSERDAEKRLRVQAENDARRAKAAADQAAAAAAAASRSLKIGEKQLGGAKDGEAQELRVEIQQLKAKNHGLNTQMDALAADHERLAGLLAAAEKDKTSMNEEARQLRESISALEEEKKMLKVEAEAKKAEREILVASSDALKAEAAALDTQNQRLGDELDRLAGKGGKKKTGRVADPAELAAAVKARKEAEEHTVLMESQLSELQVELRTVQEELAAMQDEAELKAGAAREGIAAADAQTAAVTKELAAVRAELVTLRANECPTPEPQAHGAEIESLRTELGARKMELEAIRQKAMEADALCKEAEAKASASETRAMELHAKVSAVEKAMEASKDEDGMTAQLMETMTLLKDAEMAKRTAEDELASKSERMEELERQIASHGHDEMHLAGEANGDDSATKMAAMQAELDDLHDMLNNVSCERDEALKDLRSATEANGRADVGTDEGEEVHKLREECLRLRDQVCELEDREGWKEEGEESQRGDGGGEDVVRTGPKRVKSLEDQVERLAEEHTRQSESWRELSAKMEKEKEELSQELIGAKLQVAQLYMEVDGIKLRHRQAALAKAAALEIEDADELSPTSSARTSPPPSPNSPITMDL